jgi:hypothetical protein
MALDKLTRHKTGVTILTEDVANSWYGGLYGTPEGATLDQYHPLNAGHKHDGQHKDGSAQKIDLAEHVTGELDGANIQDGSITAEKLDPNLSFGNCCALLLLTNDGRLIVDNDGVIMLKETE